MKEQLKRLSDEEGRDESRLPEFTEEEKKLIKGTCDFYSLQMYSTRLITTQDQATMEASKKMMEAEYIQEGKDVHDINTLLYWFRPGWYGDMEVWTAIDQDWEKAESIWLRNTPWGLRRMINWIDIRYPQSGGIWITENGISLENKYADVDRNCSLIV